MVGMLVFCQFNGGFDQVFLMYFQFMFKQFEQCECISSIVCKVCNDFVVVEVVDFFYVVFYYCVIQCGLIIIGDYYVVVMVYVYYCCYEQIFWLLMLNCGFVWCMGYNVSIDGGDFEGFNFWW